MSDTPRKSVSELFDILTYEQLGERLSIPKRTLERYVALGKIPCIRIGSRVRFYWPDVIAGVPKIKGKRKR